MTNSIKSVYLNKKPTWTTLTLLLTDLCLQFIVGGGMHHLNVGIVHHRTGWGHLCLTR